MKAIHNNNVNTAYVTELNSELTESKILTAENFLIRYLKPKQTWKHYFDDLHLAVFNSNSLKNSLHISQCMNAHSKGMFYQQQLWIQAPLKDASLEMNAESYGFTFVKKENLIVPDK